MVYVDGFSYTCENLFSNINKITTLFVLPLFFIRVFYFSLTGASPGEIGRLFKGIVLYFLLIASYPQVLNIILDIPHAIQDDSIKAHATINSELGSVPYALRKVLETITVVLYHLGQGIFSFFLLVMSGIAPIIFLLGTILGIGLGVTLFFSVLIMASTWPIIWYGLDNMFFSFSQGESAIGILTLDLLVSILKIVVPSAVGLMAISSSPASFVSSISTSVGRSTMKFAGNKTSVAKKKMVSGLKNNNKIGSLKNSFFGKGRDGADANSKRAISSTTAYNSNKNSSGHSVKGHSSFYPNDKKTVESKNGSNIGKTFASSNLSQPSVQLKSERSSTNNSYHRNSSSNNQTSKHYSSAINKSNRQIRSKKRNVFLDKEGGKS